MGYSKLYYWYLDGGRIPRKTKKQVLAKRISSCELRRRLKGTVPLAPIKTMFERREFSPYGAFCPKCGEPEYVGSGNRTEYPEHWEQFRCLRCRNIVGEIDNSPFYHVLEFKEFNYKMP